MAVWSFPLASLPWIGSPRGPVWVSRKGMNAVDRNPASALQVDVSRDGVAATVTGTGELDITTAPSLTRRLLEVGAAHPDRLVLDLSGLVFVDVEGARALDEAHALLLQAECPVILRAPRPSARKFLGLGTPGS